MPYDFEIKCLNNETVFSDAKSSSYKFKQPIILSSGELSFISQNKDKYHIHRLYEINENPKLRVCKDIYHVSDIFLNHYQSFDQSLKNKKLYVQSLSLKVPTELEILNFESEMLL